MKLVMSIYDVDYEACKKISFKIFIKALRSLLSATYNSFYEALPTKLPSRSLQSPYKAFYKASYQLYIKSLLSLVEYSHSSLHSFIYNNCTSLISDRYCDVIVFGDLYLIQCSFATR